MDNLVAIKMKDFQSWADGIIELSSGLNVIKGENSGGKSSVFNALMLACNPNKFTTKEKRDFIRYGKEYAEVSFVFEKLQTCIVRVLKSKVVYYYTDNLKTTKFDTYIGYPPQKFLDLVEVYVEPESGFLLNVVDSDRQFLLVNSDQKADSSLVSALIQNNDLKRLINLFEDKIPKFEANKNRLRESKFRLEKRI